MSKKASGVASPRGLPSGFASMLSLIRFTSPCRLLIPARISVTMPSNLPNLLSRSIKRRSGVTLVTAAGLPTLFVPFACSDTIGTRVVDGLSFECCSIAYVKVKRDMSFPDVNLC